MLLPYYYDVNDFIIVDTIWNAFQTCPDTMVQHSFYPYALVIPNQSLLSNREIEASGEVSQSPFYLHPESL